MNNTAYLGLDMGSTTVKAVLADINGRFLAEPAYIRSVGRPLDALREAMGRVRKVFQGDVAVGITGSGRQIGCRALGLAEDSQLTEIYAHALGARHVCGNVRSVIDIGGQDSKLIRIGSGPDGALRIDDFSMNELCAAGTGAFLEMHASELGYRSIETFGIEAAASTHPSRVAARCSVLAQSDVVHLRQKGEKSGDIAAGLCRAVALNVLSLAEGRTVEAPALFQGGVAANVGVAEALRRELGFTSEQFLIPAAHGTIGALGAALHAARRGLSAQPLATLLWDLEQAMNEDSQTLPGTLEPLREAARCADTNPTGTNGPRTESLPVTLGLDVGSASVKIAALDLDGLTVFTYYALHGGQPMESLYRGLDEFSRQLPGASVKAAAVTGSGRDLVELRAGADVNIDEITAQGEGAIALDPGADAIFEIGGQDSKFIRLHGGNVADFEMNRICAAGTGAFVMEGAKVLGVEAGAPLDRLAFESTHPVALSSRCCVFAKSDIVSLLNSGVPRPDVAAGLVYAVIKNYLTLVVGNREVGRRVVFLGGLARNSRAVVAALQALKPDLNIVVPHGCEVSGAIGAARIALKRVEAGAISATRFRGATRTAMNCPEKEFVCRQCTNECSVRKWRTAENETRFTGGVCGRYEDAGRAAESGRDLADEYLRILKEYEEADGVPAGDPGKVIGIPRALLYYEQGPSWLAFLRRLGFRVILSRSGHEVLKLGNRFCPSSEVCLPIKALVGHVAQLQADGVERVFFPTVVEYPRTSGATRSESCMLIQSAVDSFLKTAFPAMEFVSPVFAYRGRRYSWNEAMRRAGISLGAGRARVRAAIRDAVKVEAELGRRRAELSRVFLDAVERGEPCAVLIGRAYSLAPELNMGISRHLARLGTTVAPLSLLPVMDAQPLTRDHTDLIFRSSQELILGAHYVQAKRTNLFPVVLNQFLCRQDCAIIPFVSRILADRPCLQLALDENAGDAGFRTRCSAFRHVMDQHMGHAHTVAPAVSPFRSFAADRRYRGLKGSVWISPPVRFFSAGFEAVGIRTRLMAEGSPELIERGRKYFPNGEPCVPFIQLAGSLEKLKENPEFDSENDWLHIPGTRQCASTTLPHLIRDICGKLGLPGIRILSPRDGLDLAEAGEVFGLGFVQNLVRGMFGDEYLRKLALSIRPYEIHPGETDRVFAECLEGFYASFRHSRSYFKTLKGLIARLASVPATGKGTRPRILVTGEYVVRTDPSLNQDIWRRIEALGGEALRTPLFADYVEIVAHLRYKALWSQGRYAKAAKDFFLTRFCLADIRRIRGLFAPWIPDQVEPSPMDYLGRMNGYLCGELDPGILMEFYQTLWNLERGGVAGIVNVHPFGCSISSAVEPLLTRHFSGRTPILKLSFDGQSQVHHLNRLAAFMECVHSARGIRPGKRPAAGDVCAKGWQAGLKRAAAALASTLPPI